ncbi:MAG TPA: hypothetical protein ENJ05_08565 [Thiotrichales bacterium]|nr:hypothetical protein [Thiotrichales bacterium]
MAGKKICEWFNNLMDTFKKKNGAAAVAILMATFALDVAATPISGEFGMFGSFTPVDEGGVATSLASATGVDFSGDSFRVVSGDGSFLGLVGMTGAIKDVQFAGFSGPVAEFWSVGGFSFRLDSLAAGTSPDPSRFLMLTGEGLITDSDGHQALASWQFTGNGLGGIFSWSAGVGGLRPPAAVPEPASWTLAVLALAGMRRLRGSRTR